MLDSFCIFTKGGALLWTMQLAALRGDPVNALIRTCLLEERLGESSFSYTPPSGSAYTMKWTLHNGLGLVFVAVYQRALKLLYVDELLQRVKQEFSQQYKPDQFKYKAFEESFRQMLKDAENSADMSKHSAQPAARTKAYNRKQSTSGSGVRQASKGEDDDADSDSTTSGSSTDLQTAGKANGAGGQEHSNTTDQFAISNGSAGESNGAFDTSAIKNKLSVKRPPGGKMSKKALMERAKDDRKKSEAGDKSKGKPKEARKWAGGRDKNESLDYSEKSDGVRGASDGDSGAESINMQQKSLVDMQEAVDSDDSEEESMANGAGSRTGGLLSSFVRNIGVNVMGTQALSREDIQPALEGLKSKFIDRNVAEEIASKLCESVATTLVGKKLGSFTRVSTAVRTAVEEAITRILTPKRSIDVLREAQAARSRGKPYVIVFVGVNGVGKSTNLAKIAYWLVQNKMKVQIAACDTFRSGAVEQLRTHCNRLSIPLYERGYEKDPAKVAYEAIKSAERSNIDVLLVDTAGRMQDNEPLMRALSNLINLNEPDLTLFVGEALVGNDAVDQLTKFNQRLADLARTPTAQMIQGLVLTKMDTIDDKVGAALSMVYVSGAPIMFVGCGQTYVDLKKLNVKSVVKSLLK